MTRSGPGDASHGRGGGGRGGWGREGRRGRGRRKGAGRGKVLSLRLLLNKHPLILKKKVLSFRERAMYAVKSSGEDPGRLRFPLLIFSSSGQYSKA